MYPRVSGPLTDGAIAGAQHHVEVVTSKIGSCCYYKRSSSMTMGANTGGGWLPGVPFWSLGGDAISRKKRDTNRGDKEGLPSREKGGLTFGKRLRWLGGCWF